MCNLYTVRVTAAEVAAHFGVPNPMQSNAPEEVYPGTPGMVVTENEGARELRSMTWGFPIRLKTMKPDAKPKPVNNVRELTKGMWVGLARKPQWRRLIPVTPCLGRALARQRRVGAGLFRRHDRRQRGGRGRS